MLQLLNLINEYHDLTGITNGEPVFTQERLLNPANNGTIFELPTEALIDRSLAGRELVILTDSRTSYGGYFGSRVDEEGSTISVIKLYGCVITPLIQEGSRTLSGFHASAGPIGMGPDPVSFIKPANVYITLADFDRIDYLDLQCEVINLLATIEDKLSAINQDSDINLTELRNIYT